MKEYTDIGISPELFHEGVRGEDERQVCKWGVQTHSAFEWLTYITEELGELAEAISEHEYRNGSKNAVYNEAIQVATLALKVAEMYKS